MNLQWKKGQVDTSISIMKEVAKWGRENGLRLWLDEWLTREELVNEEASEGTFCVGYIGREPACTMILQWEDREWWPHAKKYEAAYIHKLCVRRHYSGMGLSKKSLDYAISECKKHGVKYIRLDTGNDEEKMKKLYLHLGFTIVRTIQLKNGKEMALYEYAI